MQKTPPLKNARHRLHSPPNPATPASEHIDTLPTIDMLRVINDEDAPVPVDIAPELPHIAAAVDAIAARFALVDASSTSEPEPAAASTSSTPPSAHPPSPSPSLSSTPSSPAATPHSAPPPKPPKTPPSKAPSTHRHAGFGKPANVCANIREAAPPTDPWAGIPEPLSSRHPHRHSRLRPNPLRPRSHSPRPQHRSPHHRPLLCPRIPPHPCRRNRHHP